jgi:tetratricopeptide (TPR) repeat protein
MTTETPLSYDERYEAGIDRYEAQEPLETLIPHFQSLRQELPDPRVSVALSWLYTLSGDRDRALHHSREAKALPQGKYNHALALLTFNEKGVREKLEEAYHLGGEDGRKDAMENLQDAIRRKGGSYPAAEKMFKWLKDWS